MKKFILAMMVLVAAASVASAGVAILWSTANWGETTGGDPIAQNNDVLWQLIYAGPNNMIESISGGGAADPMNNYLAVGSDDVVWANRVIPMGGGVAADGTDWDEWVIFQGGVVVFQDIAWNTAGFVYQRVFQSAAPVTGTLYWETALLELNTAWAPPATGQSFYVDSDNPAVDGSYSTGPFVAGGVANVIPEPATMSLLGLGALVMAIRRRRA